MMVRVVSVMASTRCSTRRVTKKPPARPSTMTRAIDQRPAASMMSIEPLALVEIAADQQAEAARQLEHPHQRVDARRARAFGFVERR